jgi:uroporphyrin-III C-methyltransferase
VAPHAGKVYLVGAGPGHPQLLTLKAYELIRRADIIIYDRLIPPETLASARADVELVYVGKSTGRHQSRQEETNEILIQAAHRARIVVRLKGGDPVLFGRGAEEAEHLAAHGIPFEIVPGVTAGLSVPMAAGIPVTHRDYSSSVALVTGHRRDDLDMPEVDWAALARIDTLVFFMSVGTLPEIAHKLIEHGRSPETPAAIIQMAYLPGEQVVVGMLEDLPRLSEEAQIQPPATVVVGEVVRLRERLTTLHRDLRRPFHETVGFGVSAESLLGRISATIQSAKDVLAAVELHLFDSLEEGRTPEELAQQYGFALDPLRDLLSHLAGLGLLLREEGRYRNAEAASLFLIAHSDEFLGRRLKEVIAEAERYDPLQRLTLGSACAITSAKMSQVGN